MTNYKHLNLNRYGKLFTWLQKFLRFLSPAYTVDEKHAPDFDKPVVLVAHHENMKGPVRLLLWLPFYVKTWVFSSLTEQQECFNHYVNYTFTQRFNWPRWFAKIVAWPLAYLVASLTHSMQVIPVYRQSRRIRLTLKQSLKALDDRIPLLIFASVDYSEDAESNDIYEGFLSLEKFYYRRTKQHINFVPLYANPESHTIQFGQSVNFADHSDFMYQRQKAAQQLQDALNKLAVK